MYGEQIPVYVQEHLREWRRDDRHLSVRRSLDCPGMYILERKAFYRYFPPERPASGDRCYQLSHGTRTVFRFYPNEISWVSEALRRTDIQRLGGAKALAAQMDHDDEVREALQERGRLADLEAVSSEAYDWLSWRTGSRVSLSGPPSRDRRFVGAG